MLIGPLSLVLTQQPKELFEKWMSMIPGGRICDPAELKSVCPPQNAVISRLQLLIEARPTFSLLVMLAAT